MDETSQCQVMAEESGARKCHPNLPSQRVCIRGKGKHITKWCEAVLYKCGERHTITSNFGPCLINQISYPEAEASREREGQGLQHNHLDWSQKGHRYSPSAAWDPLQHLGMDTFPSKCGLDRELITQGSCRASVMHSQDQNHKSER